MAPSTPSSTKASNRRGKPLPSITVTQAASSRTAQASTRAPQSGTAPSAPQSAGWRFGGGDLRHVANPDIFPYDGRMTDQSQPLPLQYSTVYVQAPQAMPTRHPPYLAQDMMNTRKHFPLI